VDFSGNALQLLVEERWVEALRARIEQRGWASFPKTHTDESYIAIASVSGSSGSRDVQLPGLTATFPIIQTLPNGEILVVAPRCYRHPDGNYELNAKVYDHGGKQERQFLLGDGINNVQTNPSGDIWVGYSDEGVYGNFGWQGVQYGAAGLSCFSKDGHKMWDFEPPEGLGYISDCYALNVARSGAWVYYYTDFPIVLIDSDWRTRGWSTDSPGGRTFAISDERVLFYGGYGDRRSSCSLLQFEGGAAKRIAEVSLVLPSEVDLSKARVIGRDKELHVFFGDEWFVFSIDSLG